MACFVLAWSRKAYLLGSYLGRSVRKWGVGLIFMAKVKVSMTIDEHVYEHFRSYCRKNGMKVSSKVEQMMRSEVKDSTLAQFIE